MTSLRIERMRVFWVGRHPVVRASLSNRSVVFSLDQSGAAAGAAEEDYDDDESDEDMEN